MRRKALHPLRNRRLLRLAAAIVITIATEAALTWLIFLHDPETRAAVKQAMKHGGTFIPLLIAQAIFMYTAAAAGMTGMTAEALEPDETTGYAGKIIRHPAPQLRPSQSVRQENEIWVLLNLLGKIRLNGVIDMNIDKVVWATVKAAEEGKCPACAFLAAAKVEAERYHDLRGNPVVLVEDPIARDISGKPFLIKRCAIGTDGEHLTNKFNRTEI